MCALVCEELGFEFSRVEKEGWWFSCEEEKERKRKIVDCCGVLTDPVDWLQFLSQLYSIKLVDRHPQFRHSRCLFVVRTDGGWIDFSYQKCLRAYVRNKYPSHAERFIREHFKRVSC